VNDCVAVGYYEAHIDDFYYSMRTLVETWNGTVWSVSKTPNQSPRDNELLGVSCTSVNACTAVGGWEPVAGPSQRTLVETWNGTSWHVAPSANGESRNEWLNSVSCLSAADCVAVGETSNPRNLIQTLSEVWNGATWTIVPTPDVQAPGVKKNNALSTVSCSSPTHCAAVGYYVRPNRNTAALIESWNGTDWSVTAPHVGTMDEVVALDGTLCTTSSSCIAVGVEGPIPIMDIWNGARWTAGTTAENSGDDVLETVSCALPSWCAAVGYADFGGELQTLAETEDGPTWSIESSPNVASQSNLLYGVSCTSASACVAVGYDAASFTAPKETLTEVWDGTSWSVTPSPDLG
jgi:hypothetical protein